MVDMIIQCEGKYPTVQLKPFLFEAGQKGIFYEENIFFYKMKFSSTPAILCYVAFLQV